MIQFHLPPLLEEELRKEWGENLDQTAKLALLTESYRTGRLSLGELSTILNMATQFETETWLQRRGVARNYGLHDLADDRRTIAHLLREL